MRFVDLEFEGERSLAAVDPPLQGVRGIALFDDACAAICDAPDPGAPRLLIAGSHEVRPVVLDAPGLLPRLLIDSGDGGVIAIGDGENSGALFDRNGDVVRRYNFGEGIVDAACDPDGNIVVLRSRRPFLDRYGPDGDLCVDDPQLTAIGETTIESEGRMLLVQRDGSLWLNLAERYDREGRRTYFQADAAPFAEGRVSADLLGWDGILVLDRNALTAVRTGGMRGVRQPAFRPLSAESDLLVTREEVLWVLDTRDRRLLRFRILSE